MTSSADTLPNPESSWARLASVPKLDTRFLESHLSEWPELLDRRWQPLGGGLRSLNLRSGDLVARIALEPDHDLRKEVALLRLAEPVVRVPRVLEVGDRALLLEYVPVCELPATTEAGFSVGTCAAFIHDHRFAEAGFLDERLEVAEPFESASHVLTKWCDELIKRAEGRADTLIVQIRDLWREHAERLENISECPVLVHSDFKPANVKWSPQEHRAVVFDWDFAWAGPNVFDIGQLFRWDPPPPFAHGFESGYRAGGGRLPDDWRRAAELYDLLSLAGFLVRDVADPIRDRDVRNRVRQTLDRHRR